MIERFRGSNEEGSARLWLVGGLLAACVVLDYGAGQLVDHQYGASKAAAYLEASGYRHPQPGQTYHLFPGLHGCDSKDQVGYDFTVQGADEQMVDIIVCKGILKGATIRQR